MGVHTPTVLLVDDEEGIRLLWKLVFELHGGFGSIWEASDGGEALARLKAHGPDVVVTDFEMPVMSGLEVIDAVRSRCPSAIVVMASGAADVGDEALRRGASAFFSKSESTTQRMPTFVSALLAEGENLSAPSVRPGRTRPLRHAGRCVPDPVARSEKAPA